MDKLKILCEIIEVAEEQDYHNESFLMSQTRKKNPLQCESLSNRSLRLHREIVHDKFSLHRQQGVSTI